MEHPEQQLQSLERFFCASFASCHRSIVNSSISLWNRLFENFERLEYPEQLKAALVQMQLHADIILPGLDTSSVEHAGQQPQFIDSFEDFSLPRLPSTRSNSRKGTPRPPSSQSKSPASIRLAMPGKLRVDTSPERKPSRPALPRLRHDDSQVHFAAIAPSSDLNSPIESQVLTERQKEIRERQRENAGLFPEIRSSPGVRTRSSTRNMLAASCRAREATPEPERAFDDYVSSTPTPRRGQAVVMPEHDLTDPPSSPPVPRGNPLAAEIRSRSVNHSLLEDWQFSSSPVSGSPNPNQHGVVPDPSSQRGYVSVVSLPVVDDLAQSPNKPLIGSQEAHPEVVADEVIEDSMIFEHVNMAPAPEESGSPVKETPTTPRRSTRLSQTQTNETPTPKSEGEEFVDAPTSPFPASPRQTANPANAPELPDAKPFPVLTGGSPSFDLSDADERSFLRLVVALSPRKVDPSEYHRSSASPQGKGGGRNSPISQDCIVVRGEDPEQVEEENDEPPRRLTRASLSLSAKSSSADPDGVTSSQGKVRGGGRGKRKRASSKANETGTGLKRQRQESVEVPSSQISEASGADVEVEVPEQAPVAAPEDVKQEIHEERIPSSSAELSSLDSLRSEISGPQDPTPAEAQDAMDVEGDDYDVQSQIALESFSHSQRQEMEESEVEPSSGAIFMEEAMQVDEADQLVTTNIENEETEKPADTSAADPATNNEEEAEIHDTPEPNQTQVQKIIALFRGGLEALRSVRLSRQEVYEIEDVFMDMRRELYEAERRGRTQG